MNDLQWHPAEDDPAREAGIEFTKRLPRPVDSAKLWLARQGFWCGVKWAREQHSLPVLGSVGEGGDVTWKEMP